MNMKSIKIDLRIELESKPMGRIFESVKNESKIFGQLESVVQFLMSLPYQVETHL